jgi:hypothetical protein
MSRRTILGAALALIAAAAIPLGLPRVVSAAPGVVTYNQILIDPQPIEQPGTLSPSGTNTVTMCIQPRENGKAVAANTPVNLSIQAGLFTSPAAAGGSAEVTSTSTALTATPTPFNTQATCNYANLESSGSLPDAVPVTYTGPNPVPINGRDVINAADPADGTVTGVATYVFSPVVSYVISNVPIATTGSLAAGQQVLFTVTANDGTAHAVPGAFLDLSLTSTAASGGSATGVNSFSGFALQKVTNLPTRFGANNSGSVAVTYTAASPLATSGVDTITAQNHPHLTFSSQTTYTYGATAPFSQAPYTPVPPFRVCDTRPAGHGVVSNQCDSGVGSGPLTKGATRVVTVDGFGGVPASGVTAVVVNLTAVSPSQSTFLTLFPDLTSKPSTSNLNPVAGANVANLVEVGVSAAGKLDVYNAVGTTNIILDIEGFVSATSTGLFSPMAPVRICDTRAAIHGITLNQCDSSVAHPIGTGGVLTFNVHTASDGIPSSGVAAVVFNLTAISPTQSTVLTAYGVSRPNASNLNLVAHATLPNRVIVPVSPSGTVSIWNGAGSVNVAVDVNGWFAASGPTAQFTALASPGRVCNTLNGNGSDAGCTKAPVGARQALNINVTGIDGLPVLGGAHSPVAVVINVTAINPSASTFVSVYPGLTSLPGVSDLNVLPGTVMTNLVVVQVGSDGTINLYNAAGSINLIVDVLGFYS